MSENKLENPSRRNFGKMAAGLGVAATVAPFTALEIKAADDKRGQEIRVKNLIKNGKSPIVTNKDFGRFPQTNLAFYHESTLIRPNAKGEYSHWIAVMAENAAKFTMNSEYTTKVPAPSVAAARSALGLSLSMWSAPTLMQEAENRGFHSWNPMTIPPMLAEMPPHETDPDTLTTKIKYTARMSGADLVGIAPLDRNWIFTDSLLPKEGIHMPEGPDDLVIKNIVFKDVKKPVETETELIIPNSVNNVIVTAFAMNREALQTAPTLMAEGAVGTGYARMGMSDLQICEYVRSQGYIAIPCVNGVGQSVPMAIDAGIGENSRMGIIVSPEYGPNIRLSKVLTNMPLTPDGPISFGVEKFCNTCKKCARECPSKCLSETDKTFTTRNVHNRPGVYTWQGDYKKCHDYWVESGSSCALCVAVCPFTKGDIWIHDGVEWAIENASFLDPVMLGLDDAMGYGVYREPEDVWKGPINTYGLDADHFQDTKVSYGGKKS